MINAPIATCPGCSSLLEEQEWTNAYATADGEAAEESGVAWYCVNKECELYNLPVEDHE